MTQLHRQIAAIAQNDPAIHVSELVLINLITNRLDNALNTFRGGRFYQRLCSADGRLIGFDVGFCLRKGAWRRSLPPAAALRAGAMPRRCVSGTAIV
jgi:hypothetical protein